MRGIGIGEEKEFAARDERKLVAGPALAGPARIGRIRAGEPADFVALQIAAPEEFGWQFGGNLAAAVFRSGRRI